MPWLHIRFNEKILSENTGHTALIFSMWQLLMVLYINYVNHAPEAKFGYAPGVDSLHKYLLSKFTDLDQITHTASLGSGKRCFFFFFFFFFLFVSDWTGTLGSRKGFFFFFFFFFFNIGLELWLPFTF